MQPGYIRRSCNSGRSGVNIPEDKQKRAGGYYTIGMQDYALGSPDVECDYWMCGHVRRYEVPGPHAAE